MGANSSLFIDFATESKVQARAREVLRMVSIDLSLAYTQCVIKEIRCEMEHKETYENGRMLHAAPVSSTVLKSGYLLKRGDYVKSWKQRYVVVHNEAENFRIDYFDGTSDKPKLRGSIHAAGYSVDQFSQEECALYGSIGIKLIPRSSRRRIWYIKCIDLTEQELWFYVFTVACFKARPIRDADDCISDALESALFTVRWQCGIWGACQDGGTPAERLLELVFDVLENDLKKDYADASRRAQVMQNIQHALEKNLKSLCATTWLTIVTSIQSMSSVVHIQVENLLQPLLRQLGEIKTEMLSLATPLVNNVFEEQLDKSLRPLWQRIHTPVLRIFLLAVRMFHGEMRERLKREEFLRTKDGKEDNIERLCWEIDCWTHPILRAVDREAELLHVSPALTPLSSVSETSGAVDHSPLHSRIHASRSLLYQSSLVPLLGISLPPGYLVNVLVDSVAGLLRRAVHTFRTFAGDIVESEHDQVLAHVTCLLYHDCYKVIPALMRDVFRAVLVSPIEQHVLVPCRKVIAPLQGIVETIQTPGVATLVDLNTLLEEIVEEAETNAILELMEGYSQQIRQVMLLDSKSLGVQLITLEG